MDVPLPLTVTATLEHGVLEGIELKINHRVTATDQDNALFIIQLPYFIRCHKFPSKNIIIPAGTATLP